MANRSVESISVIDTASLEVVATLDSRQYAGRIEIGPNGHAIVPNGGGGGPPVLQYLRVFDVRSRTILTEEPLGGGELRDGNFGVLIHDGLAFASDPDGGRITMFDLNEMSMREMLVINHEAPDGMAWTPVRLNVMTQP